MAITADYHLHSSFSGDSRAPMTAMIESGIQRGLTHMCFTEHMDLHFPVSESIPAGFFEVNTDSYLYELLRYKEKYASQIHLAFGVELGLQSAFQGELSAYASAYEFDFIIGSSHLVNGIDPYEKAYFEGKSEEEAYSEYFSSIIDNIQQISDYDVYGHLDYVVRYGPSKDKNYSYEKYNHLFDRILTLLLEKGKGLELNTGGLRHCLTDVNPCRGVLKRYRELGGEIITVGSDAHSPEYVAGEFKLASDILLDCGFKYYSIFKKRRPEFIRL